MIHIKFLQDYNTEAKCAQLFKEIRDQVGVVCKACGCMDHYWLKTVKRFRCKRCKWETTLRSGTMLEYSKLPYRYWLYAISIITSSKKPVSALEIQKKLGHKFYQPIWLMMHKLRVSMGHREEFYIARKYLKAGYTTFGVSDSGKDSIEKVRDSEQQAQIAVQAQEVPYSAHFNNIHGSFKFLKLKSHLQLEQLSQPPGMLDVSDIRANLKPSPVIVQCITVRRAHPFSKEQVKGTLVSPNKQWVNIMISNAKRNIRGIHHNVKESYLQNYMSEFCYMTNRRYTERQKFTNLLCLAAEKPWYLPYVQGS